MSGTAGNPIDLTWHVMDLIDLAEMADQAWRRGGWLIMLRARAEKPPVDGGGDDAATSPTKRQSTGAGAGVVVVMVMTWTWQRWWRPW